MMCSFICMLTQQTVDGCQKCCGLWCQNIWSYYHWLVAVGYKPNSRIQTIGFKHISIFPLQTLSVTKVCLILIYAPVFVFPLSLALISYMIQERDIWLIPASNRNQNIVCPVVDCTKLWAKPVQYVNTQQERLHTSRRDEYDGMVSI